MSEMSLSRRIEVRLFALSIVVAALSSPAFGQSQVGRNSNAVGPTPDGFYRGIPHYQDNEPHCDRNPTLASNIICMANGYGGADDLIGDAWPRIYETQDNARTWQSRYATGSAADPATDLGLGFGADPIMVCWPGGCGGFFIASNRAEGGGSGGGVFMQLLPEFNIETGFRHLSEVGPRTVQLGTGSNFLDKIDAIFLLDTQNPGTVDVTLTVEKGAGITETVTREWPKGRLIVVYAAINSSQQNVRIFSTYSDNFGQSWSPPKQVANTTGVDTGVAVAAIDDTVVYAYRQFQDDSGGEVDAVFAAVSTTRGRTVRKPFVVVDDLCAFDQPTLPNADDQSVVASRTNNFLDLASDGNNFVMVLTSRLPGPNGCLAQPFDYPAGSRVLVTTAGSNGRGWSNTLEELAEYDGHSFQFMPAVDCELGICQAIWYDSINDSARNIAYLQANFSSDAVDAFKNFPLFGDFYYRDGENGPVIGFRRTADVFTRQFKISGGIQFQDTSPVQVSRYQRARLPDVGVVEVEQNPFNLKAYKGNTVSFMGDYIGLASKKIRSFPDPNDPTGPPIYEPNNGPDSNNPLLKPSWFAYWTDARNARGQLYTEEIGDVVPFKKTNTAGGGMAERLEEPEPGPLDEPAPLSGERKLSAEGVEDSNPGTGVCTIPTDPPGGFIMAGQNANRIKDADVYGALIEVPATAWVLNASKGLGNIQRTYVIAARNEALTDTRFRFQISNQPVGFDTDDARASWLQLPFANFNNSVDAPLEDVYENVGPQSSVTVALFVVSTLPVNPVGVNVYEVDTSGTETLVETLTVNGALEAGDLLNPANINPLLPDVNDEEIHNPVVIAPNTFEDIDYSNPDVWNPDVWNPDVWNPDVWNPDVWNPDVWNPDVWNPDVWNPDVWNPDVWNPDVWNVGLTDGDDLDNAEIPSPNLDNFTRDDDGTVAKYDVQFNALNDGNTMTPYVADFAANSSIVRQLLASGEVRTQIIVSQDAKLDTFQACYPVVTGENRILAVVNDPDLLNLMIPDIINNRYGSVTYYAEPGDNVQITIRFIGTASTIRTIAPELNHPGLSYVVSSQAANTFETDLNIGLEQAINDAVPPTLTVNSSEFPVELVAERNGPDVGAELPLDPPLVTATKEFENPVVTCSEDGLVDYNLGDFAPLGLGVSTLTCSATAENGAVGDVDFEVDVQDLVDPMLGTLPAARTTERETLDGATLSYTLPSATDEIDLDVDVSCDIAPGETAPFNPPGPTATAVFCTATDDSGNTDSASFMVTVEDTTAPVLVVPGPITADAMSADGASVTFVSPSATDVGNVDLSCTAASGDQFPIGTTTVFCTATDDANLSTADSFDVTVSDNTPPTITPVADITAEANTTGGANVGFTKPTAEDFGQPLAVSCDANPNGAFYALGSPTEVTCTASDGGGNTASTGFTVTVVDTTPPSISVPADISAIIGQNVSFTVTATDIADANPIVSCDPPTGTAFPLGTTTVSCTATDAAGLSAIGSFNVSVAFGGGSTLNSNKKSVKAGSVAGFTWAWEDFYGNPVDVGEGTQDIEARLGSCESPVGEDVLNEDPGSSDIRRASGDAWQFNWQTVDDDGAPIEAGTYCVTVLLLTTNPPQTQSTEIRVRR